MITGSEYGSAGDGPVAPSFETLIAARDRSGRSAAVSGPSLRDKPAEMRIHTYAEDHLFGSLEPTDPVSQDMRTGASAISRCPEAYARTVVSVSTQLRDGNRNSYLIGSQAN
jgi:hypothetical protein